MRKGSVLAALLLGAVGLVWLLGGEAWFGSATEPERGVEELHGKPVEPPSSLIGLPPPPGAESDRAFPDLPRSEVPDGAGRIEPGELDVIGRVVGPYDSSLVHIGVSAVDPETGEDLASVSTNRRGRFWLRLPEPRETVRLVVQPPQAAEPLVRSVYESHPTGRHDVVIELRTGVWLEGTVVDEADRPVDAIVRRAEGDLGQVQGGWARTDEAGAFRIAVPSGSCRLYADSRQRGAADSPEVEVRAPASDVRLVCPPTRTLTGRIPGLGDRRAEVYWRVLGSWDEEHADWEDVAADGSFTIEELPPGRVVLVVDVHTGTHGATTTVDTRTTTEVEFPLVPGLEITGWVRTAEHPERWMVYARHLTIGVGYGDRVDRGGAFRLRGLVPGTYEVSAHLSWTERTSSSVRVEAGREEVVLAVEALR